MAPSDPGAQVFPRTQGMALQLQKAAALVRDVSQYENVKTVAAGYHSALGLEMRKPGRCVPHRLRRYAPSLQGTPAGSVLMSDCGGVAVPASEGVERRSRAGCARAPRRLHLEAGKANVLPAPIRFRF